ncbi:MAG: DUF4326 domain-containing protein [Acidimicrobiia bacterium]|nr:DUF4326 domain-containing protein [Acidimicrobiia bacterium]
MVTIDQLRSAALALPGAFEHESYGGRPSWRTKPRMFSWVRDDPEALVVWVESIEEKEALIESEPAKFFTIPHYDGHPIVLVRLDAVDASEAAELVTESWRLRAPKRLVDAFDAEAGDGRAGRGAPALRRFRQRRGERLPDGVKSVARPSRWGNPYRLEREADRPDVMARYRRWLAQRLDEDPHFLDPLRAASGVACYCQLDVACHADIIIEAMQAPPGGRFSWR